MPHLARRRDPDRTDSWQVYLGDVHAGTIAPRSGNPHDTHQWEWRCGCYPGSRPGEHTIGTAATLEAARANFERAWTGSDFQAWRDQRD